ncbi:MULTISPECIES: lipopolysaccharide biosynthesis protein [Sphingobium]|uniref:lipopolysaccharide biosynthesis protein n=1 Tax=Sphingobium TaxID=165695 RepID=UPI0015EC671E|nr:MULTISPECIES: oligosaccharide flippase family protein [Sphingobium]MCW2362934.1 O-antigen/teichoic acid export membrane protein [Sphingobium sp. B10D3B]MCW2400386.1 O-antigen/teichoic acid export membrane protein [Sphingobium sp. B10D7B]MCW2407364.1 O-antigen/teichoic acid export membrane protein [Sphingobium xanthum]
MTIARGEAEQAERDDISALARGGRANVLGFVLRLAARIPFLFIAGRLYGAATLGRFAYAVLVIEFAAQLATMGLKRGLAEQLAKDSRPQAHVVADAMWLCILVSAVAAGLLIVFPEAMFPNSGLNGLDRLLPLIVIAIATTEVALAACAYQYNIAATVRARAIVEPWTISIAALALYFYSPRDGLILAYVASMAAAMLAAFWPLMRHYGLPRGWRPHPGRIWHLAVRNLPLAGADAIEWGTRRLDLAILGLFASPAIVGIYYVAQQVASLPQKLKTSFEPILGPVITRNIALGNHEAIGRQVSQVGFWIVAAQLGVAVALAMPGEAVMGLVGPTFVIGAAALGGLLAAEVLASPAVVSEAALVYLARLRNLYLSLATVGLQAMLTVGLLIMARRYELADGYVAAMPAVALAIALGCGAIAKSRLLGGLLGMRLPIWRSSLVLCGVVAGLVGFGFTLLPRRLEWIELVVGLPLTLAVYCVLMWKVAFGEADRTLFRKQKLGASGDDTPA